MRRAKKQHRLLPFAAGALTGYAVTLVMTAVAALLLLLTDKAEGFSGAAAVIITAVSCFCGGRKAGKLSRHNGLRTGALSGVLYLLPLVLVSAVAGFFGTGMLWVKAVLCVAFGAAGGVAGVNSEERR